MNELRWILLIAGALLIAGIYAWGLRTRSRRPHASEVERRPAVFTGGARGFERVAEIEPDGDEQEAEPAAAGDGRRLEPAVVLDEAALDTQRPAIERRAEFEAVDDGDATVAPVRREPALGRRVEPSANARAAVGTGARQEPTLGATPEAATTTVAPWDEPAPSPAPTPPAPVAAPAEPAPKPARPPQKIFAVRVSSTGSSRFDGQQILDALQAEGLQFGRYDIFHCLHGDGKPIFSVASLRDPGTFDVKTMAATQYPGILVFTVLPGPVGASEAFDEMLFTARALATHLDGALADEKGVPLTAHRAGRLREEALEFERSLSAA